MSMLRIGSSWSKIEQQVKNLESLPSDGGVPRVGDPSDIPSEVSVTNVDSEPVVVPTFIDVAEVSEVEVLEQIVVNPVDGILKFLVTMKLIM